MNCLFNAVCAYCQLLKPRCCKVRYWSGASALAGALLRTASLCEECRKPLKGHFKVDEQHTEK